MGRAGCCLRYPDSSKVLTCGCHVAHGNQVNDTCFELVQRSELGRVEQRLQIGAGEVGRRVGNTLQLNTVG